ncbi:MAG: CvpA family protein [Oscillospiraceae bacterium]|nr:CvpA family protein [Oscillospiraceae bacterium]
MSVLIDLLLLAVFVLCIVSGVRKGFVYSVMNFISFIAAFVCGWLFAPSLGAYYKENIFITRISETISDMLHSLLGTSSFETLFAEKPSAFTELITRYNTDITQLETFYSKQVNVSVQSVSDYIADPIATGISNFLAFLTIFLGALILLKILTIFLDMVFKLPVLNAINRTFGCILGIFCGFLYVSLIIMLLVAVSPTLTALNPEVFKPSTIENSMLLNLFKDINLFSILKIKII